MRGPRFVQRLENGLLAALAFGATLALYPSWWWVPLAAFLFVDLSALGYLHSAAVGAACYNAAHHYGWAAVAAAVAVTTHGSSPGLAQWCGLLACAWAFHVGVDRMLGFGLKLPDPFAHTHLDDTHRTRGGVPGP